MVNNYICDGCIHELVCKKKENIDKFKNDVKRPLEIEITINECTDYDKLE